MAERHLIIAAILSIASAGCDGEGTKPGAQPSGQPTSEAAPSRAPLRFTVEPYGSAVFALKVLPDPPAKSIKGIAKAFAGTLDIDPYDLTRTRGEVSVDLTTLEAHGFGDESIDAEITAHARDFLQVGKGSLKEAVRFARFTIKSIDLVSDKNVMKLTGDKRTVEVNATGDLEIHGIKKEKRVELVAIFQFVGDTLWRVTLKTAQPIVVSLGGHDIKARGSNGEEVAKESLGAAGAAHADEVSVTFEVSARPPGAAPAGTR
jgi:polyisoprenoid-binding protein YceI